MDSTRHIAFQELTSAFVGWLMAWRNFRVSSKRSLI